MNYVILTSHFIVTTFFSGHSFQPIPIPHPFPVHIHHNVPIYVPLGKKVIATNHSNVSN